MTIKPDYITEETLWNGVIEGDKKAFEQLFRTYSHAMLAYGLKLHPDREIVKDCIQDVFVRLLSNHQTQKQVTHLKSYLLTAIRHSILDRLEKERSVSIDHNDTLRFCLEASLRTYMPANGLTDEQLRQRQQLHEALEGLTDRQQEAIYLYYIQEVPVDEIARLLGMNEQSVRNLIFRALTKLRSSFLFLLLLW